MNTQSNPLPFPNEDQDRHLLNDEVYDREQDPSSDSNQSPSPCYLRIATINIARSKSFLPKILQKANTLDMYVLAISEMGDGVGINSICESYGWHLIICDGLCDEEETEEALTRVVEVIQENGGEEWVHDWKETNKNAPSSLLALTSSLFEPAPASEDREVEIMEEALEENVATKERMCFGAFTRPEAFKMMRKVKIWKEKREEVLDELRSMYFDWAYNMWWKQVHDRYRK